MISNLIGAITFILFWSWGFLQYVICIFNDDVKCGLNVDIGTISGLISAGFFLILGFILFIIGIIRDKSH